MSRILSLHAEADALNKPFKKVGVNSRKAVSQHHNSVPSLTSISGVRKALRKLWADVCFLNDFCLIQNPE